MKRTIAILLLLSLIFITSCSEKRCAEEILLEFCKEYPINASLYSSLAHKGDEGYIDGEMLYTLYGTDSFPTAEFSLALYGKVDTVREIGVFLTDMGEDRIELTELITNRIKFLSSFSRGEGFIRKYKGVLVYGFVEDSSYAEALFDRII